MRRNFYIFYLFPFFLLSCVEDYIPDAEAPRDKLVIKSEIDATTQYPTMLISSSFSDDTHPVVLNGDLEVSLYENGNTSPKPFTLIGDNGQLWRSEDPLDFKEGVLYFLNIDATPYGFLPIRAETVVPFAGEFDLVDSSFNTDTQILNATLKLEKPPGYKLYYHLDAFLINNDGIRMNLEILDIITEKNAVHKLESKTGILIGYDLMSNGKLLPVSIQIELNGGISSLINDNLFLELKTVTEDYYLYYKSLDNHLETIQNPFSLPEITFTNITNGYGLFTAFSTSLDSIRIQ